MQQNGFIKSAVVILSVTGAAKLFSALAETRISALHDTIIYFLPNRELLFAVGALELGIAVGLVMLRDELLKLILVAWLSTLFWVYRLGLWLMDYGGACECLGTLTDLLRLKDETINHFAKFLAAYLFLGSYGLLLKGWFGSIRQSLLTKGP